MPKLKVKGDRFWVSLPLGVDATLRSRAAREGVTISEVVEKQICIAFEPRVLRQPEPKPLLEQFPITQERAEDFITIKACKHTRKNVTSYGLATCLDCGAKRLSNGVWE